MADVSRLPGPNADIWDWQMDGACRGEDPNIFFHPEGERGAARENRQNAAKALCNRCPVITECAAHALSVREPYGVWGGMTERERRALLRRRPNVTSWRHLLQTAQDEFDRQSILTGRIGAVS